MDNLFERRRQEVIDLTSCNEGISDNDCQNGRSSISQIPSSGPSYTLGSIAPANSCALQEIYGNGALEGDNTLIRDRGFSHPRVSDCPLFYSNGASRYLNPPQAYSSTLSAPNILSQPKQQTGQQSKQVDLSQSRKLKGQVQVPFFPPYKPMNSKVSASPQSEIVLNQLGNCSMPNQVLLDPCKMQIPIQRPLRPLQESAAAISRSSGGAEVAGVSRGTRTGGPFAGAHLLLLEYLHTMECLCQQNQCGQPSCVGMKQIIDHISLCKEVHCTKGCSRLKELLHHYTGCRESTCPVCIPVRMKRKRNSEEVFTFDICHLKADTPSDGTADYLPPSKRMKLVNASSQSCQTGVGISGKARNGGQFDGAQKLLLDYLHAVDCPFQQNHCEKPFCKGMKQIICHISACKEIHCTKGCARLRELLHHYKGCGETNCPICIPVRRKRKRNLQEVSTSDTCLLRADSPSIGTTEKLPPAKRIKLVNSSSHSLQTGASMISPVIVDLPHSLQGLSCVCPESTCARNGTHSRMMDVKASQSLSKEKRPKLYQAEDENLEDVIVNPCNKLVKVNQKNSSRVIVTSGIHLAKDVIPCIDTTTWSRHRKHKKLESTSSSHSCPNGTFEKSPIVVVQCVSPQGPSHVCPEMSTYAKNGTGSSMMGTQPLESFSKGKCAMLFESKVKTSEGTKVEFDDEPVTSVDIFGQCEEVEKLVEMGSFKLRMEGESKSSASSDGDLLRTKSALPSIKGRCLIDSFTSQKVRDHIKNLRKSDDQENARAEINRRMEDNKTCSLCGMEKLILEHPPKYCGLCSRNICMKGSFYYSIGVAYRPTYGGDADIVFCSKCYKASGSSIMVMAGNVHIPKTVFEKKKHDNDDVAELWVHCAKCQAAQHQICALFNGEVNKDGTEHTCPSCFLQEMESGLCNPVPQREVFSAENLPRTKLSDHLEEWLFRRLKNERQDRANSLKRRFDEVPAAEGLVIRVVSSVDKKLAVKEDFLKVFQEKEYPTEFPYKSKAILLFQTIEGADVCLFCMYVQEFGSACPLPNQRKSYISYIDSINCFRPEIKSATGEALRSFIYHETLIGYLDYCKERGFTSCYIWSCPPKKRDDYILYCHPTSQKIPKPKSLREWYERVIQKAEKEKIVVEHTNLYDHYFKTSSESKAKVTASRLPYFDGDYWPEEAEKLLQEGQKKGNKAVVERDLRSYKGEPSSGNIKDIMLMHQLEEKIGRLKKDFIVVHLQHTCKHCCQHIVSGSRWVRNGHTNFHLCDKCHSLEQQDRHARKKYSYVKVEVESVPTDTIDEDGILRSDHFDTRLMFLSLCQSNHYQFDTLRRAKHSTMMVLYHLHNTMSDNDNIGRNSSITST